MQHYEIPIGFKVLVIVGNTVTLFSAVVVAYVTDIICERNLSPWNIVSFAIMLFEPVQILRDIWKWKCTVFFTLGFVFSVVGHIFISTYAYINGHPELGIGLLCVFCISFVIIDYIYPVESPPIPDSILIIPKRLTG